MKVSCDIIQDLLPLYAENLTSEASNAMVDEHLCGCDGCTKQLGILKKKAVIPAEVNTNALVRVGNAIRSRRMLTALTVSLVVLSIAVWLLGFMNVPVYLTAEEAIISVEKQEDNALVFDYADYIIGGDGRGYMGYDMGVIYNTTRWTRLSYKMGWRESVRDQRETFYGTIWMVDESGRNMPAQAADADTDPAEITDWACDKNWYYINYFDGKAGELLWDAGEDVTTEMLGVADRTLLNCCIAAAVLAGILALVAHIVKGNIVKKILGFCSVAGACYALSSLAITMGQLISYGGYRPQLDYILALTGILTGTILCGWKLHVQNKQDKAS